MTDWLDTVVCGDCLDVMAELPDNCIDTVITDPPYGLEFMGKDWDRGVPGVRYWREALRVAKPGAMLLAFGGTRTHHRLMCAIEDAGWEIRDCMMLFWVQAQGFPKSANISKLIDRAAGAEREVVGEKYTPDGKPYSARTPNSDGKYNDGCAHNSMSGQTKHNIDITAPATPEAALWDGYGTALKPAYEPIVVAMKPRDGTFAENALAHGVAGLWIDGGRIGLDGTENLEAKQCNFDAMGYNGANGSNGVATYKPSGRWPANVLLQHSDGCKRVGAKRVKGTPKSYVRAAPGKGKTSYRMGQETGQFSKNYGDADGLETVAAWECVPGCPVRMLGEQSGDIGPSFRTGNRAANNPNKIYGAYPMRKDGREQTNVGYGDTGTAARFFYQAKASKSERNAGCDDLYWRRDKSDPFGFVQITRDEWEQLPQRQRAQGNVHPTVKPLGIVEYLCKLTRTPTGGIVLDPFCGSGTIPVGAILTNRQFIACDITPGAVTIANARIEYTRQEQAQLELF